MTSPDCLIDLRRSSSTAGTDRRSVVEPNCIACDVQLPTGSTAAGTARRWIRSQLAPTGLFPDRWQDGGKLSDVLICTSELVNASVIANSTTMALQLRVRNHIVRVSLLDDCAATSEPQEARTHLQLLVLRIFDTVTEAWGIDPSPSGRTLWFELYTD